jgi:phosphoglucosamine mutase
VDGDQILGLCARDLLEQGRLAGRAVVATVMSNVGLQVALQALGVRLVRTAVGDRAVLEEMLRHGYVLGGEQSGHIIFTEHNTTGDGVITMLQVLAAMQRAGRPLSQLAAGVRRFPQVLINVQVARREDLAGLPTVRRAIEAAEGALAGAGRVLVRFSGTEPLARVMLEGPEEERIRQLGEEIADTIRQALGG